MGPRENPAETSEKGMQALPSYPSTCNSDMKSQGPAAVGGVPWEVQELMESKGLQNEKVGTCCCKKPQASRKEGIK